jgi:hypothetical protein
MLQVITKVRDEKWESGIFAVQLSIRRIVFGRVGDDDHFGWEKRIRDDHAANGAI